MTHFSVVESLLMFKIDVEGSFISSSGRGLGSVTFKDQPVSKLLNNYNTDEPREFVVSRRKHILQNVMWSLDENTPESASPSLIRLLLWRLGSDSEGLGCLGCHWTDHNIFPFHSEAFSSPLHFLPFVV